MIKFSYSLIFIGFFCLFSILGIGEFKLTDGILKKNIYSENHYAVISKLPSVQKMIGQNYSSKISFISDLQSAVNQHNSVLKEQKQWDKVIWTDYTFGVTNGSFTAPNLLYILGFVGLFFIILGVFLIISQEKKSPTGIKNNDIFKKSISSRGILGIILGCFLIIFYIVLYWFPEYLVNWVALVNPISKLLSGNPASQWFLYGLLYTVAIIVMGIRFIIKYRHSKYQQFRTGSVIFFQTTFAFLLPEILMRLNLPYQDLKNIFPLDYTFFFDYKIQEKINSGTFGIFMLGWGIFLFLVGTPLMTYFYGKRWYCSWICGCGGLAETVGDSFRQLSDKSLKSWKIERYTIYGVLVFAGIMTVFTLYSFFTGQSYLLGIPSYEIQKWYGFFIGSIFAGVVGTGFYPLMGNRVWCRFGCPLAAYMGIFQRFKSKFRITVNGGQCISCGNCSTYCEMGIDVRAYAQRGQDVVRASCVGCGVCSAVCPRGVLNLETGSIIVDKF